MTEKYMNKFKHLNMKKRKRKASSYANLRNLATY